MLIGSLGSGCGDECGDATYNTPALGGSKDSVETCGIIGTFVNDSGPGAKATLFPRPEHGNVYAGATFVVAVDFPGGLAPNTTFTTKPLVGGTLTGGAYWYPPATTEHKDAASLREGTISVISVGTPDSSGRYRATLEWDLHFGDGSDANNPWYSATGRDEMNVTAQ